MAKKNSVKGKVAVKNSASPKKPCEDVPENTTSSDAKPTRNKTPKVKGKVDIRKDLSSDGDDPNISGVQSVNSRIPKGKVARENSRCRKDSSSDGSIMDNPADSCVQTGTSRKCKVKTPSKRSNVLKNTKLRRISESSCDSVTKEAQEESNNAAENEQVESTDQSPDISQKELPISQTDNEPTNISPTKDTKSMMGWDKYSEIVNLFNSKEEDLKDFINQFKVWQQSKTKQSPIKKKKTSANMPPKLEKPIKSKIVCGTPKVRLAKTNLKEKVSRKRRILKNDTNEDGKLVSGKNVVDVSSTLTSENLNKISCDVEIPDEDITPDTNKPVSYETESNSLTIVKEIMNEANCNVEVRDKPSVADIDKAVSEKKGSDSTEKLNKTEVHPEEVSSGNKELNVIPEEIEKKEKKISGEGIDKYEIEPDNIVAASNKECEKDSINNELERSEYIENNLDPQHSTEKNEKNDLEVTVIKSANNDSESSSELNNEENYVSIDSDTTDAIPGVSDPRPIETEKWLASVSSDDNKNIYEQEDSDVDKQENFQNVNDSIGVNSSNIDEEEFESEIVWKRKRNNEIDDTACCAKKIKTSSHFKLPESSFDQCHDELIYSDDDKTNHLTKVQNFSELVTDSSELVSTEDTNYYTECCTLSRSQESSLDIHKRNLVEDTNSNDTDHDMSVFKECEDDEDKSLQLPIDSMDLETPLTSLRSQRKHKKNKISKTETATLKKHRKKAGKVAKISSKSKVLSKTKEKKKGLQKSFLLYQNNIEEAPVVSDKVNQLIKQARSKNTKEDNEHKSILESDMPVVEVTYKGEKIYGIHVNEYNVEYLKMNKPKQSLWDQQNPLESSYIKDVLIQFLRPICSKVLRYGSCKDSWNCKKQHTVDRDFFITMNKYDAWLIIAFVLRISDNICESFIEAVLAFLGNQKAKKKILLIADHILKSKQNELSYQKSCWEMILKALECCGLHRWEAIKTVLRFILDSSPSIKPVVIHHLLKIWCVHSSSFSNTWSIVEPLVIEKKINLPPSILSKLVGEIMVVEPSDKRTVYRLVVKQLTCLSKEKLSKISYRLLNDFIRKLGQEGLHTEERVLRDRANVTYQFGSQPSPTHTSSTSNLSRSQSMINLTNVGSNNDVYTDTKVHEEEKMEAAVNRALQCSNYDLVVNVIANSSKHNFISKILLAVYQNIKENCPLLGLKTMLTIVKEKYSTSNPDLKEFIGTIVLTVMLDKVKQYNWKEANIYLSLLEENNINKYKFKPLIDTSLRPVRLAITCSEIYYYNGKFKEAIGIIISTKLMHPNSSEWLVPGGSKDDFKVINLMVVFLMSKLISKGIIDIGTMLFKAVFEVQPNLTEPIDIGQYFEILLYKLFEHTREFPETAVKLFQRVASKEKNLSLYGLTYRALIVLAYRTQRRTLIKELFCKAIEEYAYPIIEEKENVIMLLKSYTKEEIIVYIVEWLVSFKEKLSNIDLLAGDFQILIKFKEAVLEDFLDDQVLGIPQILKDVDQTLPGATKRLESVLKQLAIRFKQIKKDTISIEPTTLQNFLRKI